MLERVDWRDIRFDPLGKKPDLSDFRFVIPQELDGHRAAVAMFPTTSGRSASRSAAGLRQPRWPGDEHGRGPVHSARLARRRSCLRLAQTTKWQDTGNDRVLICECYYRVFGRRTLLRRHLTGEVGEIDMENPTAGQVVIMMENPTN